MNCHRRASSWSRGGGPLIVQPANTLPEGRGGQPTSAAQDSPDVKENPQLPLNQPPDQDEVSMIGGKVPTAALDGVKTVSCATQTPPENGDDVAAVIPMVRVRLVTSPSTALSVCTGPSRS